MQKEECTSAHWTALHSRPQVLKRELRSNDCLRKELEHAGTSKEATSICNLILSWLTPATNLRTHRNTKKEWSRLQFNSDMLGSAQSKTRPGVRTYHIAMWNLANCTLHCKTVKNCHLFPVVILSTDFSHLSLSIVVNDKGVSGLPANLAAGRTCVRVRQSRHCRKTNKLCLNTRRNNRNNWLVVSTHPRNTNRLESKWNICETINQASTFPKFLGDMRWWHDAKVDHPSALSRSKKTFRAEMVEVFHHATY